MGGEEEVGVPDRRAWNVPTTSSQVFKTVNFHTTVAPPDHPSAQTAQGAFPTRDDRQFYLARLQRGRLFEKKQQQDKKQEVKDLVELQLDAAYKEDDEYADRKGYTGTRDEKALWAKEGSETKTFYHNELNWAMQHRDQLPQHQRAEFDQIVSLQSRFNPK
jgi:hypothetical protein